MTTVLVKIYAFTLNAERYAVEEMINELIREGWNVIEMIQSSNKYGHLLTVKFEK